MATVHNNAALAAQLTSKTRQGERGAVVNSLGHDPTGPGAQGAPATKNERNAATYARFKKEYNSFTNRLVKGELLSQQNLNRYESLPGLMAQYAPKNPNLTIAVPGAGAPGGAAPGRNLPSPGMGLGNMFGLGAGKSRRRRNRRKSRKNRRRSRKN